MNKQGIHILLADDHPMILSGLQTLLDESFDFTKVSSAKSGKLAIEIIENEKIDLVITDWEMPDIGGYEIAKLSKSKNIKTVVLTSHTDIVYLLEMISLKVDGIFLKKMDNNEFIEKILDIWEGKYYLDPEVSKLLDATSKSSEISARLTKREKELLIYQHKGLSQKEIGLEMKIDVKTVEKHKYNVVRKMHVKNIMLAVIKAMELGIINK